MTSNQCSGSGQLPEKKDRYDNLGWLAGSAVQPRKRKEIEGVSTATIYDMQAQLYQAQEHARQRRDGVGDVSDKNVRRRTGLDVSELLGQRNAGVEDRDRRDKLELKSTSNRASECYAALERKAKLYEKLARGEAADDDEQYEVDFMRKGGYLADEEADVYAEARRRDGPVDTAAAAVGGSGNMISADMERERERRQWEKDEHDHRQEDSEAQEKRRQHKEVIMELAEETKESRAHAAQLRQRKEEQSKQKLNKLKEGFLKEQLKKQVAAAAATGAAAKKCAGPSGGAGRAAGI